MSLTVEQLEAARAERMRQNGHGAITIEDVRTWIEETGLCIFLPRSAQAGFTAPTFVEAVAGQRTTEPTLELIATAEALLVRLEAEGVAVRLNLAGLPGDQPDYVVAGWVLPYIYALRGDRDWRRSPQLTGSRQVSQLAVQAAKQLDSANMNATQIRDALGREVTETAVLRALHELWKQLRIIPVVPEVGQPALWQPLRQRFQKAIAEGASTSQVTAISVLASIYLQAVIAASMEDVELFLSPLTSKSKIREVVRGLAATRQVHSTTMGHSPMFYVAGTLPEFPAVPSFQIGTVYPAYRGSSYLGLDHDASLDEEIVEPSRPTLQIQPEPVVLEVAAAQAQPEEAEVSARHKPLVDRAAIRAAAGSNGSVNGSAPKSSTKPAAPRPRTAKTAPITRNAAAAHPRERSRAASGGNDTRSGMNGDRRRAPASRATASNGHSANGARSASNSNGNGVRKAGARPAAEAHTNGSHTNGHSNGHGNGNGSRPNKPLNGNGNGHSHKSEAARPARSGWNGAKSAASSRPKATGRTDPRTEARSESRTNGRSGAKTTGRTTPTFKNGSAASKVTRNGAKPANGSARPAASRTRPSADAAARKPAQPSAVKRYSFAGQAKQAPKPINARGAKPVQKAVAPAASKSRSSAARPAAAKRRG